MYSFHLHRSRLCQYSRIIALPLSPSIPEWLYRKSGQRASKLERSTQIGEAMRSSNRIPFKWRRASREVAPEMSFYFSYTSSVRSKRGVTPIIQRSADVLRARLEGPGAAWIFVRHRKHRSYGISGAVLAFRGL